MLILMLLWALVYAQSVTNVRAVLEPVSGYYTISFDLNGKSGDEYLISLTPYLGSREITKPLHARRCVAHINDQYHVCGAKFAF